MHPPDTIARCDPYPPCIIQGNLVGKATWRHGKVWEGTVAHIYLSCGVAARRETFQAGKRISAEWLKGEITGPGSKDDKGSEASTLEGLGFAVHADQWLSSTSP